MEQLLIIMEIVALFCLSALSIYLIVVLLNLKKIFTNIEQDIREISNKAAPVLENVEAITGKFRNITENMSDDFEMLRYSLRSMRDAVDSLVDFEQRIQQKIEEPVMESVTTFTAFLKGVKTFFQFLRS